MTAGIYALYNRATDEWYIGESRCIENRLRQHSYTIGTKHTHNAALRQWRWEDVESIILVQTPVSPLLRKQVEARLMAAMAATHRVVSNPSVLHMSERKQRVPWWHRRRIERDKALVEAALGQIRALENEALAMVQNR